MPAAARRHEVATRYYTAEHRQHDDLYTRSRRYTCYIVATMLLLLLLHVMMQ